jgi:DNA-binding response OmpR family regulator
VRVAVDRALSSNGYRVIQAARPFEALELIATTREPVHLVLTDMMLPEMTGSELIGRLRRLSPGFGVLFMSGTAGAALAHFEPGAALLQKPFSPDGLVTKVRAALDARAVG